ncbi:hypothetical protein [Sphingomonas sp. Ant H11]|uniref:hypothetical protein n=1 Tax=Sphingomonas sp. Ant H11 TaxID=1564113 RepID=UPI001E4FEF4C|nr:hypothetical protein [Sphingomonas sp. Ant H11]
MGIVADDIRFGKCARVAVACNNSEVYQVYTKINWVFYGCSIALAHRRSHFYTRLRAGLPEKRAAWRGCIQTMMLVGIKAPMIPMLGRMGLIPFATAIVALSACSSKAPPPPPTPQVSVALPLQRDVVDWDEYVGRFEAIQDVQLLPRVSGTIDRIFFCQRSARAGR